MKVDVKDVSNVVKDLKALGIVTGEVKPGTRRMTYTVVGNIKAAVALKTPAPKPSRPKGDNPAALPSKPRAKRRTPFVMAIDAEIKRMEDRICLLRKTRKEFE